MRGRVREAAVATALMVGLVLSAGCAAASCPAVLLNPGIRLDAGALMDPSTLNARTPLHATMCLAAKCTSAEGDQTGHLYWAADLRLNQPETITITVTDAAGSAVHGSITTPARTIRPYGKQCPGVTEIDLRLSATGVLTESGS